MESNSADLPGLTPDFTREVSLPRHSTVAIIGAGPAASALGAELRARGLDFVMLEKGEVGDAWRRMPRQLKLVSPWKTNWLTRSTARRFPPHAQLSREQFVAYLREFAIEHDLPVVRGCEVISVESAEETFRIRTSQGDLLADMVVNATGIFPVLMCRAYPATTAPASSGSTATSTRRAGRAGAAACHPQPDDFPLHAAAGVGDHGTERLLVDGIGVRIDALARTRACR